MTNQVNFRNIFRDPEFWAILLFNMMILLGYYTDAASGKTVIVLYYLQSVLIGLQTFIRMIVAGARANKGFGANFGNAFFFAMHFGGFHLAYFVFIVIIFLDMPGPIETKLIAGVCLYMLLNMIFSTVSDVKKDTQNQQTPYGLMFLPYLRILPIHLFIILSFNVEPAILLEVFYIFLLLKTVSDLIFHVLVNKTYKGRRPKATEGWI